MTRSRYHLAPGLGLLVALVCLGPGCRGPEESRPEPSAPSGPNWFDEVTDKVHLDFTHDAGPLGTYFMPQVMGSGAALFDFDGDGLLDIYLVQNGGPESPSTNRLYHQRPDGTFEDVSARSGLNVAGHGMGVAIGDVNNDGRPDVLLTEYRRTRLFLNEGNGHFKEATEQLGTPNVLWATSACFFDYDRDGWLDLVVTNYVDYDPRWKCNDAAGRPEYCLPNVFPGSITRLYHNRGRDKEGHWLGFQDVTLESGLAGRPGPGLGVVCADFDGDGWPDIFIANDNKPNHLWMNRRDGTFKEEAAVRGVALDALAQSPANMGIALGDIDGDGLFDLYVTHVIQETNTLWQQGPKRGFFQDRTAARGLAATQWRATGFGTVFGDFDDDGALDLAVVNGAVLRLKTPSAGAESAPFWSRYAQRNQLLANDGTGHFRDVSLDNRAFCGPSGVYRGLAVGDIFNRGALDLVVTETAGRAHLFRNAAPRKGHWLVISAVDPACGGRDAYGAVVTVTAGKRRWVRWLNPGFSYLCSNDPRLHFGLGEIKRVDTVHVLWPDGSEENFPGRDADRSVRLEKGRGARHGR